MTVAITAAVLVAGAVYLMMQRELLRVVLGFVLLGHAANLVLIAAGGTSRRGLPFGTPDDPSTAADPLPQAFVLTAIVIAFSITVVMLVLAVAGGEDDDTDDGAGQDDDDTDPEHVGAVDPGSGGDADRDQDRVAARPVEQDDAARRTSDRSHDERAVTS
ncbi:cation:proton antiporter subunit C [Georgenia sp. Z1491]|uniref:cation:proton antiporter subunit C n=1 Tax=Georgenia sp. Z1491 TaxID=3416707 RepID=UPI003CF3C453